MIARDPCLGLCDEREGVLASRTMECDGPRKPAACCARTIQASGPVRRRLRSERVTNIILSHAHRELTVEWAKFRHLLGNDAPWYHLYACTNFSELERPRALLDT